MVLNNPVRPAIESAPFRFIAVLVVIILASGAMGGCAAPLLKEISQAQEAIALAKEARAEQYASNLLRDAQASINEALQLGTKQRRDVKELLLRATLQADVAATLAKERAVAEQLQSAREEREKAQAAATAAEQAAQVAKDEMGK